MSFFHFHAVLSIESILNYIYFHCCSRREIEAESDAIRSVAQQTPDSAPNVSQHGSTSTVHQADGNQQTPPTGSAPNSSQLDTASTVPNTQANQHMTGLNAIGSVAQQTAAPAPSVSQFGSASSFFRTGGNQQITPTGPAQQSYQTHPALSFLHTQVNQHMNSTRFVPNSSQSVLPSSDYGNQSTHMTGLNFDSQNQNQQHGGGGPH